MVADDAQHMLGVLGIARKGPQFARYFRRRCIGHAGHDRGQRPAKGTALVTVVGIAHVHQQPADVRIAKPQCAEVIRPLRDLFGGELRHHHADLQRHGPQTRSMHVIFDLKNAVLEESQQVHRRQVAGRVVKEHIFRTGVRAADRTVFGASVPVVHRVVVLDPRIGAGPCGMADLIPKIAGPDGFHHTVLGAADQFPIGVLFHCLEEGIGDPDRVVGVLTRNRIVRLRVPIGVIGREFDAGVALFGIVQHALDVGLGDRDLFGLPDRGLQLVVLCGVIGIRLGTVPCLDRVEQQVQLLLMHLGAGDDARHLLLFEYLPVDEIFDIGVVGVDDYHLGRATGGAAGFDGTSGAVPDLEEPHQTRRLAAARQLLALSAER